MNPIVTKITPYMQATWSKHRRVRLDRLAHRMSCSELLKEYAFGKLKYVGSVPTNNGETIMYKLELYRSHHVVIGSRPSRTMTFAMQLNGRVYDDYKETPSLLLSWEHLIIERGIFNEK